MSEDPPVFQVLNEIGIIEQLARNRLERVLPEGLKMSQFVVLNHCVRLGDGKSPQQLASAFQVTKGAMTNTLKRLQDRGFIDVQPDPQDGRSKRVFLTDAGRAARQQCVAAAATLSGQLLEHISAAEFVAMLPSLTRLRMLLDGLRD